MIYFESDWFIWYNVKENLMQPIALIDFCCAALNVVYKSNT